MITLERTYRATLQEIWEMWTTKDGIESWWGPDGFRVEVRRIDMTVGGGIEYAMIAFGAPQIEFMKKAGMPLVTENRLVYTEVVPPRRLAWRNMADFIPNVKPYEVFTQLDLIDQHGSVLVKLGFDRMHDAHWTNMQKMGWENELTKLEKVIAGRSA
jgi:uncharacterized protein YndB with AHSA1/START domain